MPYAHYLGAAGSVCEAKDGISVIVVDEDLPCKVKAVTHLPRKDAAGDFGAVC